MKTPQSGARPNASTGPRSVEGKARSSMNAVKSGIYSKSLTIPGEDPKQLTTLAEEYFERFSPALPEQRDLVDILVRSTWTLRRLAVAEAQIYSHEMDNAYKLDEDSPIGHAFSLSDRTLSRLQRMVNSTQRNFRDALRDLERLRAADLPAEPVPLPDVSPPGPANNGPQTIEKEPVKPSGQFVSSTSAPPPPTAPKAAPIPPREKLSFHRPGSHCDFTPANSEKFERCPLCFAPNNSPRAHD